MLSKAHLCLFIVLLHQTKGQSPNCDFTQNVTPGRTYYVYSPNYPRNYPAGAQCRWIATCPSGYNCKLNCTEMNLPQTSSCTMDRVMVSKTGDPTLYAGDMYCGRGSLVALSTGQNISIGLISSYSSPGGRFMCELTAQPIQNHCSCGLRKQVHRIVGGQETAPQEYPMMAAIVRLDIAQVICGATIIDSRHVLTAAHCLDERNPSSVGIVVGLHDVTGGASKNTKAYKVSRFILHPRYNKTLRDFDIGLISVQGSMEFNVHVSPACLPFKFFNRDFTGSSVLVLGWGLLFPGGPLSNTLQMADLNVLSDSTCRSYIPQATTRQMCTYARGRDACQSDSGGPLLYTDPSNNLLYHVGIVSYGMSCASDFPGINTRVAALLDWITTTTGADYCRK